MIIRYPALARTLQIYQPFAQALIELKNSAGLSLGVG